MNAKVLTVVVGLLMLVPAGFAAGWQFGECQSGYSCEETPDGDPFPPNAVTGHTVYANFTMIRNVNDNASLGLPTDFAAVAGYFAEIDLRNIKDAAQRECVVWFNGNNLDQRPPTTSSDDGFDDDDNSFPSDEDEASPSDQSYQDYDFDRDVDTCLPQAGIAAEAIVIHGNFAVVVEAGDCDPASGSNFTFRGHLDFVDPNDIYHEVQEYDYQCFGSGAPAGIQGGNVLTPIVHQIFPVSGEDIHNQNGCEVYSSPSPADPTFDLGHKCNGSVRDLFTERMWMTPIHDPIVDPTINAQYNFALQIDTCSGLNIYEYEGKSAMGKNNNYSQNYRQPGISPVGAAPYHAIDDVDRTLDESPIGPVQPLVETCTDGSSFSFDDTARGRVTHDGVPLTVEEIMRGNSYDSDPNSPTVGKHRTNCRANWIDWPYNQYPGESDVGEDCYPEDHKTAQIDIYVYDYDVTGGEWVANTNGKTGLNTYSGPGTSTGPWDLPPY